MLAKRNITDITHLVDVIRLDVSRRLDPEHRAVLGQFFTPMEVAQFMASMFEVESPIVRILDPGAGIGSLSAALVAELCARAVRPKAIHVTAYELDDRLIAYLQETLLLCKVRCQEAGVEFTSEIVPADFIASATSLLVGGLFVAAPSSFNCVILNPPYRKINSDSEARRQLRQVGIETSNLYTAFMALAVRLLEPGGEMVSITPRSFTNGSYYRPFREFLLQNMTLKRLHVFDSRREVFQDDDVLQETLVLHAVKDAGGQADVLMTSSSGLGDDMEQMHVLNYKKVVHPGDPELFIHITPSDLERQISDRIAALTSTLAELGIAVSTGRVVDFRAKEFLRFNPADGSVPLIWPGHFSSGFIAWPKEGFRKPDAIENSEVTRELLVPSEPYVLVRRFSAKEEKRRVVAAVYDPRRIPCETVGFENHLNYYHRNGRGLDLELAKGLAAFLNSTLVDGYFRLFNGHTQVNATDLRSLRYPTLDQLHQIGARIGDAFPGQNDLDRLIDEVLGNMSDANRVDPIRVKRRIDEALEILKLLGFPRAQQNERSALTLLALLNLKPDTPWQEAEAPLRGITQMMNFFAEFYGKKYAPNSREQVRRQTVHQFLAASLIIANPDEPTRPINSGKTVYMIEPAALDLLRVYGTSAWPSKLKKYLATVETLRQKYAQERQMARIPLTVEGTEITLSPGGQNLLVEKIIHEFAPLFAAPGRVLYVGDTDDKRAYLDEKSLEALGIKLDQHGKMPDVIIHQYEKNWLLLIEAVTSHGPISPKRREELAALFSNSTAGLVYVTTFLTRKDMMKFLGEISWETEVWIAEDPTHMIHFDGTRFLGPY